MAFRSFTGDATRAKKVSLGGRSRAAETREEVLERTRLEREKRAKLKLDNKSATVIQAAWRAWRGCKQHKAAVRDRWQETFGERGERATREDLRPSSRYLRELCYFANPAIGGDVAMLAAACNLVLSPKTATDNGQMPQQQGQQPVLEFCSYAGAGREARASVLQLSQRLLALVLRALSAHAAQFRELQQMAGQAGSTSAEQLRGTVMPLVKTVVVLAGGGETWKYFMPAEEAAGLHAQLLAYLVQKGLFVWLAAIVWAAFPEPAGAAGAAAGAEGRGSSAWGEALVTSLVMQYLKLQGQVAERLAAARTSFGSRPRLNPVDSSPSLLLCMPLLWARCPSLRPLGARLWHQTVAALQGMAPARLASCLPQGSSLTRAVAAAALMGNLVELAPAALKAEQAAVGSMQQAAVQLVSVLSTLLQLVPMHPFFQKGRWEEDEDGGLAREAYQGIHAAQVIQLVWDNEQLPPAGITAQLQAMTSSNFLQAIVAPILPEASAPAGSGPGSTAEQQQAAAVREAAGSVYALCALLYRLAQLPGQRQRVLIGLAVRAELAQRLWYSFLKPAHAARGEGWSPSNDDSCDPGWMLPLTLFSLAYSSFIITAGDDEVYDRQRPLPLSELYSAEQPRGVLSLLKWALWHALWVESAPTPGGWSEAAAGLREAFKSAAGKLMGQLHGRNCRRAFAPPQAFQADSLPPDRFHSEMQAGTAAGRALTDAGSTRAWGLLTYAPYLVPFHERARVFQDVVAQERARHRDMDVAQSLALGTGMEPSRFITIRRGQVLQDGFQRLGALGEGLRGRVRVQFISEHGLEEAGVDGGGIFKEFLEEVVREGFNPDLGLFQPTTDQRLYPNPHVRAVMPGQGLQLLEFLGKVLGKAMYEGILVELPLAGFFLKKFRGMYCDINDLPTLDPELHKNLVFLRRYEGDVRDLGLTFTLTDNVLGEAREVELIPHGHDTPVTNENAVGYIHRVADYKLNYQIREPTAAFLRGLHALIRPEWVSMFNEEELQMLISGGQQGLDIQDMRAHVEYAGGYHSQHPVMQHFWEALAGLSPQEQGDFLRFVTSCPRPPLLGFKYLSPPLCIQMAGAVLDPHSTQRLPTAATCMNLLKLPPYPSTQVIREKLLYAIKAGAGFELS